MKGSNRGLEIVNMVRDIKKEWLGVALESGDRRARGWVGGGGGGYGQASRFRFLQEFPVMQSIVVVVSYYILSAVILAPCALVASVIRSPEGKKHTRSLAKRGAHQS